MTDWDGYEEQHPDEAGNPVQFYVPPDQEAGAYAHTFAIWHTPYDFVIDFAVTQLAQPVNPEDPEGPFVVPAKVVSRVRIPAAVAFDLMQTMNTRMETYEQEWGEIHRPTPRETEGDDGE